MTFLEKAFLDWHFTNKEKAHFIDVILRLLDGFHHQEASQ